MNTWQKRDLLKRRFTLPNELFSLKLNAAEISIYTYLLYLENRKTHQCWPSYKNIGKAVDLTPKTVKKYVTELVDKGLISTENTTVTTKDGRKRNGNLRYTIRPIQEAVEQHEQNQLRQLELDTARWEAQKLAAEKKAGRKGWRFSAPAQPQLPAVRAVSGFGMWVGLGGSNCD